MRAGVGVSGSVLVFVMFFAPLTGSAEAHAERQTSTPRPNSKLRSVPSAVSIQFSEPPTADSAVNVIDGCGDDVVDALEVANLGIDVDLVPGEPGSWTVRSNVVSGLDGHATKDSWRFNVSGTPDCSKEGPDRAADDPEDRGSSSKPVLIIVGVTVVVALVALLIRRSTGPG